MSHRHPMAITAGAATLLAAFPLSTVFASFTWFFYAAFAVVVVVGCAMLVRTVRGPVWAQVLGMMAGLLLYLNFAFPAGEGLSRIIPTGATFMHFNDLFIAAGEQIRGEVAPVPDLEGLRLLTTVGVGLVAMLVDLAAVGLRRPALAGLPMLAIYSVPVAVIPDGLSFLPFVFASAGFIWLLVSDSVDRVRRFGRRFTGEGRDVDVWEPSPLSSAGRRLGVVGVVIAILIPLAVPGMTSGLLDAFGTGDGPGLAGPGRDGTAQAVDLNALLSDQLVRNELTNMVRVTTDDPSPFYLRFGIADQVSDSGFTSRAPAGNPIAELPEFVAPSVPGVTSQRFHAQMQVMNFNMGLAPTYDQVVSIEGLNNAWFFEPSSNQIFSRRESINGRTYSFDYVRVSYSPAALRTASPIAGSDPIRQLTVVPPNKQVTDLVTNLVIGKATEYDQVRAIYDHFTNPHNGYVYSLSTGKKSGNPIVNFLTDRSGFCVQYAAAMAWLVRAAGYPARVAFGFTRGGGKANGGYTLTNFNLHAWTEVYFPGFGWVPFDATPAASVVGSVRTSWAPDPNDVSPTETPGPTDGVDVPNQPSSSRSPVAGGSANGNDPGAGSTPVNTWWLVSAAVATLLVFALAAPSWRRRTLRRQRRARETAVVLGTDGRRTPGVVEEPAAIDGARRDAHAAWAELQDTMIDYQVDVDPAETPRATADRLVALLASDPGTVPTQPDEDVISTAVPTRSRKQRRGPARHSKRLDDQASTLAYAEERARYARTPLHPHGLDDAVESIREALAERATRWQRLGAIFLPRSVTQRWRLGLASLTGRTVGAFGRARDAAASVNPRRLITRPTR